MDWTETLAQSYMGSQDNKKKIIPLRTIPELKQAIEDNKIDEKGNLQCPNRQFVLYCYDHKFFLPLNKRDWRSIDSLLTGQNGKTLTADTLSKEAHQLQKLGLIEKDKRHPSNRKY